MLLFQAMSFNLVDKQNIKDNNKNKNVNVVVEELLRLPGHLPFKCSGSKFIHANRTEIAAPMLREESFHLYSTENAYMVIYRRASR